MTKIVKASRQDGCWEAPQRQHANLGARERRPQGGSGPRTSPCRVCARSGGCGDNDGGQGHGRGSALIHAQNGRQGGREPPPTPQSPGEEATYSRRSDKEGVRRGVSYGESLVDMSFFFRLGAGRSSTLRHDVAGDFSVLHSTVSFAPLCGVAHAASGRRRWDAGGDRGGSGRRRYRPQHLPR